MRALVTVVPLFFLGIQAQQQWTYSGEGLQEKEWPKEYPDCGGLRQSPINLQRKDVKFNPSLTPLILTGYGEENQEFPMTNNGHTVQVNLPQSMSVTVPGGTVYRASQFHCHWGDGSSELSGSEHTEDGMRYAMEIHFVHYNDKYGSYEEAKDKPDGLAVFAAFVTIAGYEENTYYTAFISELANIEYPGQTTTLKNTNIQLMLPEDTYHYYTYNGSLTTPPCTQNVQWFIFKNPIKLSKTQVVKIENSIKNHDNETLHNGYRRTQALNGRVVQANFPYFPNEHSQTLFYLKDIEEKLAYLTHWCKPEKSKKKYHKQ